MGWWDSRFQYSINDFIGANRKEWVEEELIFRLKTHRGHHANTNPGQPPVNPRLKASHLAEVLWYVDRRSQRGRSTAILLLHTRLLAQVCQLIVNQLTVGAIDTLDRGPPVEQVLSTQLRVHVAHHRLQTASWVHVGGGGGDRRAGGGPSGGRFVAPRTSSAGLGATAACGGRGDCRRPRTIATAARRRSQRRGTGLCWDTLQIKFRKLLYLRCMQLIKKRVRSFCQLKYPDWKNKKWP